MKSRLKNIPATIMSKEISVHQSNSIENLNSLLSNLKDNAPISIQEAISAQIQVITYIQSPTLIDTNFSTFFQHLKKSLKYSSSEIEKDSIRESFALMIQNYVFIMDARLQYEINENKEEAIKLLKSAGESLINSVTNITMVAVTGGNVMTIKRAVETLVKDLINPDSNLFKRLWNWIINKRIIKEKKREFLETLWRIYQKLDKYHKLIGPSIIINSLINCYKDEVCCYLCEKEQENVDHYRSQKFNWSLLGWICLGSFVGVIISLVVALIRWPIIALTTETNDWFKTQMYWTLGIIAIFIVADILINWIYLIYCGMRALHFQRKCDKVKKKLDNIAELYDEN